jgi:hypothetical protein
MNTSVNTTSVCVIGLLLTNSVVLLLIFIFVAGGLPWARRQNQSEKCSVKRTGAIRTDDFPRNEYLYIGEKPELIHYYINCFVLLITIINKIKSKLWYFFDDNGMFRLDEMGGCLVSHSARG